MIRRRKTVYIDTEITLLARGQGRSRHDLAELAGKALTGSVAMWGRDRDRDREAHARADAAYQIATDAAARIQGHEAVCLERYTDIGRQLQTVQSLLTRAGWGIITLLIIVIGSLLTAMGGMFLRSMGHGA